MKPTDTSQQTHLGMARGGRPGALRSGDVGAARMRAGAACCCTVAGGGTGGGGPGEAGSTAVPLLIAWECKRVNRITH
jgi:hypothetical protein